MGPDRAALEREVARHPALHYRDPVTGRLMAPERYHWRGVAREAAVAMEALRRRGGAGTRIVVLSRPRSGTTLLGHLLAQLPGVVDAGEVFRRGKLFPRAHLRHMAQGCPGQALVCKVLSGQMLRIAGVRRPVAFLAGLEADGFRFVHLVRNTPDQALSLETASTTRRWLLPAQAEGDEIETVLDIERLARRTRASLLMADLEERLMSGFPHLRLDYDADLADAARHQQAVDRLCAYARLRSAPVRAGIARTATRTRIANEAEAREVIDGVIRSVAEELRG